MKKTNIILGILAIGLVATACSKSEIVDPETTIPEGTADITIVESDANFADYKSNWCNYAAAVSALLEKDAQTLYKAWKEGVNGGEAYQTTFKQAQGAYTSANSCIEQIIDGCIDIANEVGENKIGDPRDKWENGKYTEAVYAVESWYSYHSIQDYSNNIRSIHNAFNCTYNSAAGAHSIAAYLKANGQADFAQQVNAAIASAITCIEGMAAPFRNHIGNPSVITAINACTELKNILRTLKAKVEGFEDEALLEAIVADYVDIVVLPTYKNLADANSALHTAVRALATSPSNTNFELAAAAWLAAREPWEMSEAFLFGPVDELGLDPNMDSWPLDQDAIKNVLASGDFSSLGWDSDDKAEDVEAAQNIRGFHTLEFLLFKNGQPRTIAP